jgi:hypothetical protein
MPEEWQLSSHNLHKVPAFHSLWDLFFVCWNYEHGYGRSLLVFEDVMVAYVYSNSSHQSG